MRRQLQLFSLKWAQLDIDFKGASRAELLDDSTTALAHTVASDISILSHSLISRECASTEVSADLTKDVEDLFANLDLNDSASHPSLSIPHGSRSDPSLPPYIEPAYKWLLKHLHNPYPKKEVKERIADETGSSIERISDWFVDVRRRMGWNALLREEFGRKRVDLIDAATRFYLHPNRKYPLSPDIHGKFVQMEAFAQDMYAAKLVPSALSNKLTAAVKDLTPERQEEARLQRLRKAQAKRDVAKLGVYPSPPVSGASSPVSDPGASTSYSGRKRSRSEASSDDDEDSLSKRFRTDGAFALPSPPSSSYSSPAGRKRRLSDADAAPSSKRMRTNRAASDPIPVTVSLSGTPDLLADWFSSDQPGDTNLFQPDQLLDIKFFDPSEYDLSEEEAAAPAQPVVETTTTLPPTELDTVSFELPEMSPDFEHLFNFDDFALDQSFTPYSAAPPLDMYTGPVVYEAPAFAEHFTGFDAGYLTPQSALADPSHNNAGFDFDPVLAGFETPLVYSALPDGKAAGRMISGLLEQQQQQHQRKNQTEYGVYQPISC
ncbi:hypothetical protein B0H14DRAFT_2557713 [Mycena olivaceomarginata]|nr:hypothetical protein B0H14DRAFT_2557713 [Mycena olivaceomarginata]